MSNLHQFVEFCRKVQPYSPAAIRRFFEGVLCFPYDNELVLQAFLYFNIKSIFPHCQDLLLFEKSPNGENTDQGKCDFVYRQENGIVIIETKYIDTWKRGDTVRKRRNQHKKKVFEQVVNLRGKFSAQWNIPLTAISGHVFTTDDLTYRSEAADITAKHISCWELEAWQQEMQQQLLAASSLSSMEKPQAAAESSSTQSDNSPVDNPEKLWLMLHMCEVCSHPEVCAANKVCYYDLCGWD